MAKLNEQCERWVQMTKCIVKFCRLTKTPLDDEERHLLSTAYKNMVGNKRASWRVINLIERKEGRKGANMNTDKAAIYKLEIEGEIIQICDELLELVTGTLLPWTPPSSVENIIFLNKLIGDYNRYVAEIS